MRHELRLLEAAALCAMALTVLLSVLTFQRTGDTVRAGVLRLHVIAHSDAPEDQKLKLAVRDALLQKGKSLAAAETKQAAEESLADAKPGDKFQFIRNGYYCKDTKNENTFNSVVGLRDTFKKEVGNA